MIGRTASVGGNVQKSSSSKASALLTRGAYAQYVSTAKGRERRWRLFSTFPLSQDPEKGVICDDIREEYQKYGIGKHFIFYRMTGTRHIEVVRILHGRMNLEKHLTEN